MQYQEFTQHVISKMEKCFPLSNKVAVHPVLKNNNLRLDALTITGDGNRMLPIIYLKQYFDQYQSGRELNSIMNEILQICKSENSSQMKLLPDITDFSTVAEKVTFLLINQKMNEERLKDIPHTVVADLVMIYVLILKYDSEGIASIIITNSLMKEWGIDQYVLESRAGINTPILFPYTLKGMNEIMRDIISNDFAWHCKERNSNDVENDYEDDLMKLVRADSDGEAMYVLSNIKGINGAGALLYPNVLHDFAVSAPS